MSQPWNDWYHIMGHTYGTWLPGDPRGFRTRHHREHVEGDYRNPPPKGFYDQRFAKSKSLMKREPVFLTVAQRRRALSEFLASFEKRGIQVIAISIDRIHFHVLARVRDHDPRKSAGLAKKESSAYMKREGLAPHGGLWATRTKALPVNDRAHQLEAFRYILSHERYGAAIWSVKSAKG